MVKLAVVFSFSGLLFSQNTIPRVLEKPERHEFVISNFHAESGVTMPRVRVVSRITPAPLL